jgi:hypothetical protein
VGAETILKRNVGNFLLGLSLISLALLGIRGLGRSWFAFLAGGWFGTGFEVSVPLRNLAARPNPDARFDSNNWRDLT